MTSSRINAFTTIVRPDLLGQTPLGKNMTFAVKANIGCGHPAPASTPSLRNWVPKGYSPVVKSLVDNGHTIVAIANMHELAFGNTSENPGYGDVDNPQKSGYIPGGSSGGSAASVAMNAVSFALGTDTAGSMRIPASLCGVVGYRPTIGLYDQAVVLPLSSTCDTIGVFAQKVSTVQQVHKAIVPSYVPSTRSLEGVRIGVPREYFYKDLDPEVARVTEAALSSLRAAGAVLVDADFPAEFSEDFESVRFDLIAYETHRLLPKFLKENEAPVSFEQLIEEVGDPMVKQFISTSGEVTKERYSFCQRKVESVRKIYDSYFGINKLEAFAVPTTILPAIKRPTAGPQTQVAEHGHTLTIYSSIRRNSFPQAIGGVPCISIPSGLTNAGLPVGLEVVGPRGMDDKLLALAASVQDVLPSLPLLSFEDYRKRL